MIYGSILELDDILEACRYSIMLLYGLSNDTDNNKLRKIADYTVFLSGSQIMISRSNCTIIVVKQHIHITELGWPKIEESLHPVKMQSWSAPEEFLNMIFCNCKKGCESKCGCRRLGLLCNPVYWIWSDLMINDKTAPPVNEE